MARSVLQRRRPRVRLTSIPFKTSIKPNGADQLRGTCSAWRHSPQTRRCILAAGLSLVQDLSRRPPQCYSYDPISLRLSLIRAWCSGAVASLEIELALPRLDAPMSEMPGGPARTCVQIILGGDRFTGAVCLGLTIIWCIDVAVSLLRPDRSWPFSTS